METQVTSKTEHNEVAPAQHEMAPIFTTTNLATDQNQLAMELIQRIAKKHGMVALLHEKPLMESMEAENITTGPFLRIAAITCLNQEILLMKIFSSFCSWLQLLRQLMNIRIC